MDILVRGVPSRKLFEVPQVVDCYLKAYPYQPLGPYHAAIMGENKPLKQEARYAVYRVKSGLVVKWVGE